MDIMPIAAVVSRQAGDADAVLFEFATTLRCNGQHVRGLLQDYLALEDGFQISLVDLHDGTRYPTTRDLDAGSDSCRLDSSLLTEAGEALRQIPDQSADLVIFDRFGALEAKGSGFSDEMLSLMSIGTPVLTIVPENILPAWRVFTGNFAAELSPDCAQMRHWFFSIQGKSHQPST